MGGQIVSRHLHATLGLSASAGASFFNGYGDALETQKRWQAFGVLADTIGDNPEQQRSAELAALNLFDLIEKQLNHCHAHFNP